MEKDEGDGGFDAAKAELFEAVSHPLRIRILQALSEKPMGFAELGRAVGIDSGGHLSFHLTKLRHMVKTNSEGNYTLTGEGKEALWSVNALQKSAEVGQTSRRPSLRHKSWLKPTIGIIMIIVLVLSGVAAYPA